MVVPNANHGMGGAYGKRRMQDFFVRHLLGKEPPDRNDDAKREPSLTLTSADRQGPARHSRPRRRSTSATSTRDRSELRGAIERYEVDRGSLSSDPAPPASSPSATSGCAASPASGSTGSGRLDFDRLDREGRSISCSSRTTSATSCGSSTIRAPRDGPSGSRCPVRPTDPRPRWSRRELKPMDWSKVAGT